MKAHDETQISKNTFDFEIIKKVDSFADDDEAKTIIVIVENRIIFSYWWQMGTKLVDQVKEAKTENWSPP